MTASKIGYRATLSLYVVLAIGGCNQTPPENVPDKKMASASFAKLKAGNEASIVTNNRLCSLEKPAYCSSSGILAGEPSFIAALDAFLGNRRRPLIMKGNPLVRKQAHLMLGGPPDDVRQLGQYSLLSACRFQSCFEKAMVAIDNNGRIAAVGLLYYLTNRDSRNLCCGGAQLLLYHKPQPEIGQVLQEMTGWAREVSDKSFGEYGGTELIEVGA